MTLANHWASRGWDVGIATFDDGSRPPFFAVDPRVRRRPLDLARRSRSILHAVANNVRRVPILRAAIRAEAPDRVIAFMDSTNVLAVLAAAGTGIPVVVSERTHPAHHEIPAAWRFLRRRVYPRAASIVVQTGGARDWFPAALRDRIRVVPNPVLAPEVSPPGDRSGRPFFLALGRLDPAKGFDLLIRAFATFAPGRPDWDLAIVGEGPERGLLESLVGELGLAGRVSLPGATTAPAAWYSRAQAFVLSSRYEGFPNALLEAMAAGLPAVAFDCESGPAEILRDGVDGILVAAGDTDALASALAELARDPERRSRLGRAAREVVERYGLPAVASRWEDVLRECGP